MRDKKFNAEYNQAIGMVIAQLRLAPMEAESYLLEYTRNRGLEVSDIVHDLTARRFSFPDRVE